MSSSASHSPGSGPEAAKRVFLLGATGTVGRATARALVERGLEVVCLLRSRQAADGREGAAPLGLPAEAEIRFGEAGDPASLAAHGFKGERFDVLVSCLASRTGAPAEAWAIDYQAHLDALEVARAHGVSQMVLLSAICVQRPQLQFQHAKLAFEKALMESGLTYSIVRPTAYFKSLSGQIDSVMRGKPFLIFGDGRRTACKPIGARDLGNFLADCVTQKELQDRILPIGGPGEAITPHEQGEMLFRLLGREPRYKQVPFALLDGIVFCLEGLGKLSKTLADKAELARIGRYYARESMLVFDEKRGVYDARQTPSYGSETLLDHYRKIIEEGQENERVDQALF
jgi:divinyl chlorophyllide a 8-vinyl-reductase